MPFQAYCSLRKSIGCMTWLFVDMHDDWLAGCAVSRTASTNSTVAGDAYLHMLNEEAFPSPLNINEDFLMWFQQDDALVHCSVRVKTMAAPSVPW